MRKLIPIFILFLVINLVHAQERVIRDALELADEEGNMDYYTSDSLFQEIIINTVQEKDSTLEFYANYKAGKNANNWGLYDAALIYFSRGVEIAFDLNDDSLRTKVLLRLGENYFDNGEVETGIKFAFEGLDLAKKLNSNALLSDATSSLAELYRLSGQEELALEFNIIALKVALESGIEDRWARVYNNIGAVLGELDRNEEAIDTLKHALNLISDSNYFANAKYHSNIAFCFRNMNQLDSALYYNQEALRLKRILSFERGYSYTYGAIGRCYRDLGQPDSAIKYNMIAYDLAKKFNNLYRLKDASIHLALTYYIAEEYKNAFDYLEIGQGLEDSLLGEETQEKINLYKRKYDYAKKEQELERVKTELVFEEEKAKRKMIILAGTAILALLIAFILALMVKRRNQEKELISLQLEKSNITNQQNEEALVSFAKDLQEKNKSIRSLNEVIIEKQNKLQELENKQGEEKLLLSETKILTEEDWTKFKVLFEKVYPSFFTKLNENEKSFTNGEKRIMSLIKLNMNNKEAADTLGISAESVSKSRFRLKKKLNLSGDQDLDTFIHQI